MPFATEKESDGAAKGMKGDAAVGPTPTHRAVLGTRGVRYIHETRPGALERAVIASISDQEWVIPRTYGIFRIPACEKQQVFTVLEVEPHTDAIDLGDNRKLAFAIGGRDIAEDLVQELDRHGVFVCEGMAPSEEELQNARRKREEWFNELIQEGDVMWARGHTHREISDMHRRAAMAQQVEREWAYVPGRHVDCPVCGEKIKANVAVCRHCRAVLDAERAAKHGITAPRPGATVNPA